MSGERGYCGLPYLGDPSYGVCVDPSDPTARWAARETMARSHNAEMAEVASRVAATPQRATFDQPWQIPKRVYFVAQQPAGPIKVGCARRPFVRLSTLQTGNPYPLAMVAHFEGGPALEGAVHVVLAEYRLTGEWFRRAPQVFDLIAELQIALGRP